MSNREQRRRAPVARPLADQHLTEDSAGLFAVARRATRLHGEIGITLCRILKILAANEDAERLVFEALSVAERRRDGVLPRAHVLRVVVDRRRPAREMEARAHRHEVDFVRRRHRLAWTRRIIAHLPSSGERAASFHLVRRIGLARLLLGGERRGDGEYCY